MNCHEDPQLEKLVGCRVKINILGETYTGVLKHANELYKGKYQINNLCFRKSHVKSIEEL